MILQRASAAHANHNFALGDKCSLPMIVGLRLSIGVYPSTESREKKVGQSDRRDSSRECSKNNVVLCFKKLTFNFFLNHLDVIIRSNAPSKLSI